MELAGLYFGFFILFIYFVCLVIVIYMAMYPIPEDDEDEDINTNVKPLPRKKPAAKVGTCKKCATLRIPLDIKKNELIRCAECKVEMKGLKYTYGHYCQKCKDMLCFQCFRGW